MATSPSHKLGQLIGNLLEEVFSPLLQQTADKSGLYLDVIGKSRKARKGKKITWDDAYGNSHDLDFVIEFGGSEEVIGRPVAFIESAWRRYTKHSKNKAQEIQGAILPIAEKYYVECPFKGAILAGEFTDASLEQLRSCGFTVLYVRYESIVSAFLNSAEIDISFGEDTPEGDLFSDGGVWSTSDSPYLSSDIASMRRIIPEPKRWTQADKDAGRLPEVGAKCRQGHKDEIVVAVTEKFVVTECQDMSVCTTRKDVFMRSYNPIETPEEKARRERNLWIENAYNFSTKGTYPEIDFGYLYDALKSGELPVPNKE